MEHQTPPPPPAHVRLADAEKRLDEALADQACRKRLKQAGERLSKEFKAPAEDGHKAD